MFTPASFMHSCARKHASISGQLHNTHDPSSLLGYSQVQQKQGTNLGSCHPIRGSHCAQSPSPSCAGPQQAPQLLQEPAHCRSGRLFFLTYFLVGFTPILLRASKALCRDAAT